MKAPCHGLRARRTFPSKAGERGGFTLAEAAVTIAIVALMLIYVLQGLQGAKIAAFYTKQRKTAYELGVGLLGEIKAGLYREELESGATGDFADKDEPDFSWEVALGEDALDESGDTERPYDNLAERRSWQQDQDDASDSDEEDDEEAAEPFEKIKVRVVFPPLGDRPNELVIEQWVDWVEIYGEDEEEEELSGETRVGGNLGENGGGDEQ